MKARSSKKCKKNCYNNKKLVKSAEPIFYFAYGSNMNPLRMGQRCPGAIPLSRAILPNYRLAERLYADIDMIHGYKVYGVLYLLTPLHLTLLDRFEGYPLVYRRSWLEVEWNGFSYKAVTYEMTTATKQARLKKPYPEEYRQICSEGARFHKIPNAFTKRNKRK